MNSNGPKKNIWKTLSVVLGIVIIVLIVSVAALFITDGKSTGESQSSSQEQAELTASAPDEKEKKLSEDIVVTSEGSTKQQEESKEETSEDKDTDEADSKKETKDTTKDTAKKDTSKEDTSKESTANEDSDNHTYQIVNSRMTWAEAEAYCENNGGHLATVGSQEEYDKIVALAEQSGRVVIWLGASCGTDHNFSWVTGEDFAYTSWMEGEPNNEGGDENYLVMFKVNGQWVWSDVPADLSPYYGTDQVGFACEWES
jgi:hypothetical protein